MEFLADMKRESGMCDVDLTRSLDWKLSPNVNCRVTLEKMILPSEKEFDLNFEGNGGGEGRTGGSLEQNDNFIDVDTDTHCYRNLKLLIHEVLGIFQKCEEKCGVCDKYIHKLFNHLIERHGEKPTDSDNLFPNKNLSFETQTFLSDPELNTIPSYGKEVVSEEVKPVISPINPLEHVNYFNVMNNNLKQESDDIECQEDPLLNPEDLNCVEDVTENTTNTDIHAGQKESSRKCQCLLCPKSFATTGQFSRHNLTHTRERPYKCETCGRGFALNYQLTSHKRIHRLEKKFACNKCGNKFVSKSYLSRHERTVHAEVKPWKCVTCGRGFLFKRKLERHMTTHSLIRPLNTNEKPDYKFKCLLCPKSFAKTSGLSRHNLVHTGERPCKCEICGKRFALNSNLTVHKRIHALEKKFACNKCGKKFVSKSNLSNHDKNVHTETEDKPFKCITCGKGFVVKREFVRHTATHSLIKQSNNLNFETQVFLSDPRLNTIPGYENEIYSEDVKPVISLINPPEHVNYFNVINNNLKQEPDEIECQEDPLLNPEDLNCAEDITENTTDTDIHAGLKESDTKFKCLLCPKSFATNANLSRHNLTHTGERPYKCETCGKRFVLNFQLTSHKRIHILEKKFACNKCGNKFVSKSYLSRHDRTVHAEVKPWKCVTCGKGFVFKSKLESHVTTHSLTNHQTYEHK